MRVVSSIVVDASAVLAVLNQEPRAKQWSGSLADAAVSTVNLSEVVAKLSEVGIDERRIRGALDGLGMAIVSFDADFAYDAGLLRSRTKTLGLSLGDRACLALAIRMKLPALTADRAWTRLRLEAEIAVMD
ncbi:MAG: type II toxin-antitoxin system VapC family toxin [bacterium]